MKRETLGDDFLKEKKQTHTQNVCLEIGNEKGKTVNRNVSSGEFHIRAESENVNVNVRLSFNDHSPSMDIENQESGEANVNYDTLKNATPNKTSGSMSPLKEEFRFLPHTHIKNSNN